MCRIEQDLEQIGVGPLAFNLIQHFRGGRQAVIEPCQKLDLRESGVERFTTAARIVRVTIDSQSKDIQAGSYSLAELKVALSVAPGRVLDQIVGGDFRELSDQRRIHIKGGEVFVSQAKHGTWSG